MLSKKVAEAESKACAAGNRINELVQKATNLKRLLLFLMCLICICVGIIAYNGQLFTGNTEANMRPNQRKRRTQANSRRILKSTKRAED